MKLNTSTIAIVSVLMTTSLMSPLAFAQSRSQINKEIERRQGKQDEWKNIAIASGALSIYGLLKKDSTLTFVGAAGALYSANRYEQDRKSKGKLEQLRASYFSKSSFTRDGVRYDRRTVKKNGQTYYQFVRGKKVGKAEHHDNRDSGRGKKKGHSKH